MWPFSLVFCTNIFMSHTLWISYFYFYFFCPVLYIRYIYTGWLVCVTWPNKRILIAGLFGMGLIRGYGKVGARVDTRINFYYSFHIGTTVYLFCASWSWTFGDPYFLSLDHFLYRFPSFVEKKLNGSIHSKFKIFAHSFSCMNASLEVTFYEKEGNIWNY